MTYRLIRVKLYKKTKKEHKRLLLLKKKMIRQKRNKVYSCELIAEYRNKMGKHIETYDKIGIVRSISGVVCVGVGILTTPIPMTTIPLIGLGCYLLGYDSKIMVEYLKFRAKGLKNWIYSNRTPKRLKQTFRRVVMRWF